jgi:hypothetical protein
METLTATRKTNTEELTPEQQRITDVLRKMNARRATLGVSQYEGFKDMPSDREGFGKTREITITDGMGKSRDVQFETAMAKLNFLMDRDLCMVEPSALEFAGSHAIAASVIESATAETSVELDIPVYRAA